MGDMSEKRAEWASKAVHAFARETGQVKGTEVLYGDALDEAIRDLICDLGHLVDRELVTDENSQPFERIIEWGLGMHREEVQLDE